MLRFVKDKLAGKVPKGHARSSRWPKVRAAFLAKNPTCAACGGRVKLEVHHITPFSRAPELELEESNLLVLCEGNSLMNCHRLYGHLGNYRSYNETVVADAATWLQRIVTRP